MLDRNVNRNSPSDWSSCHAPPESKSMRPPAVRPACRSSAPASRRRPGHDRRKTAPSDPPAPDARRAIVRDDPKRDVTDRQERVERRGAHELGPATHAGYDVGELQCGRHGAAVLRRPGHARRLAAAEDRFVGPQRHFLDLRLGVRLLFIRLLVRRSSSSIRSAPLRIRHQCVPHDPQPEAAGALTTRRNRFPSLAIVGGGVIDRVRAEAQPRRGVGDVRVARAALAVFTVAMRRDRDVERHRAQVRRVAQPVHRRLGIAVLQLAVGRAHAAHRLERAGHALGGARDLPEPLLVQKSVPAVAEAAGADVCTCALRTGRRCSAARTGRWQTR